MHSRHISFVALVLALTAGGEVSAQNLVVNGDLTATLTPWTIENAGGGATGSTQWDNDSGSATVGAVRLTLTEPLGGGTGGTNQGLSQCIASPGPPPWDYGARFLGVANTNAGGPNLIAMAVEFFNGANCTGGSTTNLLTSGSAVSGTLDGAPVNGWQRTSGEQAIDPLPGGLATVSVRVAGRIQSDATGDDIDFVFDSFYFGPDGTTPVELQSFAVE